MSAKISIYEYGDYRLFLKNYYNQKKGENKTFSYRVFSRLAGFSSPNFLKLVIEGQRNLTEESMKNMATGLKLDRLERSYFYDLVRFNQEKDPKAKTRLAAKLGQSKNLAQIHPLRTSLFKYYSHWYFVAIRELVACSNFLEDPIWIARSLQPAITPAQASEAIQELIAMGMLQRKDGKLLQSEPTLNTENEVPSPLIAQFHVEMLRLASESIARWPSDQRELSCATVAVSEEVFLQIKQKIQNLRAEILALAASSDANVAVYQIGLHCFPLAKASELAIKKTQEAA